jgi:hypothetical protein
MEKTPVSLLATGTLALASGEASSPSTSSDIRQLSSQRLVRFLIGQTRTHLANGVALTDAQFDAALTDYIVSRAIAEYRSMNVSVATRSLMIELYAGMMRAAYRDRQRREERNAPALKLIA